MSGRKQFSVSAGISPVSTNTAASDIGAALNAVMSIPARAIQAYQDRLRREREAAQQREAEIQQRITEIRSQSRAATPSIRVESPSTSERTRVTVDTTVDIRRQVDRLRSQLPAIRSEYQPFIDQQLLDAQTVQQALQQAEQALVNQNISEAQVQLQSLDDARILVSRQVQQQLQVQVAYLQERLDGLSDRLPQAQFQSLQSQIQHLREQEQIPADTDLMTIHAQVSEAESQADRVREAAENMISAWQGTGFMAQIAEVQDGDIVIHADTHEGANTEIRIQFDGQQIALNGPSEESFSCAMRTQEAMQIFRDQGYQIAWESVDDEPVPEEWRSLSIPPAVAIVVSQEQSKEKQLPEAMSATNLTGVEPERLMESEG
jgi:hypothetical protein